MCVGEIQKILRSSFYFGSFVFLGGQLSIVRCLLDFYRHGICWMLSVYVFDEYDLLCDLCIVCFLDFCFGQFLISLFGFYFGGKGPRGEQGC